MSVAMHAGLYIHFWLKNPEKRSFHAYTHTEAGAVSVCGHGPILDNATDMDAPDERSPCCNKCFSKLYKFIIVDKDETN